MPRKLRDPKRRSAPRVDLDVFRYGNGCWSFVPEEPVYASRADAERAWREPGIRPIVWAKTHRFRVPMAACAYDGLINPMPRLRSLISLHNGFVLADALQVIDEARGAVRRYEKTPPSADVRDYLLMWREDLETAQRAAELRATAITSVAGELVEFKALGTAWQMLSSANCYG